MKQASTSKLSIGETSIDRVTPKQVGENNWELVWRIRMPDGPIRKMTTRARTKTLVRSRAKERAKQLLDGIEQTKWRLSDPIAHYIRKVSMAVVEQSDLKPNSKRRYRRALTQLADSFETQSISAATSFRNLETALKTIANNSGSESAHQARTVLSKYVLSQLMRDQLITHNPIKGEALDLKGVKGSQKAPGGQALSIEQYKRVLNYLLNCDNETPTGSNRGRWGHAGAKALRQSVVQLTLMQMTTGLRISEALSLEWPEVAIENERVWITVLAEKSKTSTQRLVPVLVDEVATQIAARKPENNQGYVNSAPTDNLKLWDTSNAHKSVKALYKELAQNCDVPLLETARSHVWRATLNTLTVNVPEALRADLFGHSGAMNRTHYLDVGQAMKDAFDARINL